MDVSSERMKTAGCRRIFGGLFFLSLEEDNQCQKRRQDTAIMTVARHKFDSTDPN